MDIYTELRQEHEEMKTMMESISQSFDQKTFEQFASELKSHSKAEEQTFYKSVQDEQSTHELVLEGIEEHHVADLILRELMDNEGGTEKWMAKFKVLQENVEHHLEEEEGQLFPKAQQIVRGEQAEQLAEEFENRKHQLQ